MATSKTIQPTGETISIPAMTDRPDMSVVASDLSKITDAANALNSKLSIFLQSSDDTWAKIWAKIGDLGSGESSTIYINNTPWSIITGGARSSGAPSGTIARVSSNQFKFTLNVGANNIVNASISGVSSSSAGTYTEYDVNSNIAALPALASFPQKNSLTTRAFNIPNNARLFIYSPAADADSGSYALMCSCSSSGTVKILEIAKGSRMSFETATNRITINASASTQYGPVFMMGTNAESVTEIE